MRSRYVRSRHDHVGRSQCASTSPVVLMAMLNAYFDMRSDCHRDARWQTDLSPLS